MNRSLSSPMLVSVSLHGVLVLALLHVRYESGETSAFNVIQVEWVRSGEGVAPDGAEEGSRDEVAEDLEQPPEAVPAGPAAAEGLPEAPSVVTAQDDAAIERPTAPPLEPEPVQGITAGEHDAPPERAEPQRDAIETPRVAAAEQDVAADAPAASPTPQPAEMPSPVLATDVPAITALEPPEAAAALPPAPAIPAASLAVPPVVPIPDRQRQMLDRRLAQWGRDLQAVAQKERSVTWEHDGQAYTASFTEVPAEDDMGLDQIRVEIHTARNGQQLATEMRWQRLAFSHYAQFVDRWDPHVQIHDDEIDGRFHSNSEIFIANTRAARPTFRGKVTTAHGINTSNSSSRISRSEVFLGGLETRVGRIDLPARFVPFATTPPVGGDGVHRFSLDTRITFYADGTFGAAPLETRGDETRQPLGETPAYLLADERVELHVQGVVDGQVLVYSPERLVITGNLTYAAPPRAADADDYVGLVADGNIEIAEPDVTGPGDLTIHAAMFARHRFHVRSHYSRGPATLVVYGSLTAGSLSATEPRYGTRLEFDPRLEHSRPPSFPITSRYELADWDGVWRLEEPAKGDDDLAAHLD